MEFYFCHGATNISTDLLNALQESVGPKMEQKTKKDISENLRNQCELVINGCNLHHNPCEKLDIWEQGSRGQKRSLLD